ncbi:hypothetical protein PHYBOEH_000085 [Phytophthora boehmeriae]|uniref:Uncharacterized protein n=1 Tax=Phytophthora boehmeriae TaxID=109152 RepID=A0A8T1X872_9STRA|nr:hypothetical protein PHYBOEH_000085 [Phytophthora boehmeriae]
MASVCTLLTSLRDEDQRSPASVRNLLLELASCCRSGDAKAAIVSDGLELLLSLAADEHVLSNCETLEVLLELLVLLLLDNPKAKTDAARYGALAVAVKCLHELSTRSEGGKRRSRILRRALELVDLLAHTKEAEQKKCQKLVLRQILEVMAHAEEDGSVLLRATDTLGRFVDGSTNRIQLAASERAIPVLIGLLKLVGMMLT